MHDLSDLPHVAGWEPHSLHFPAPISWVGYVLIKNRVQHLITARQDVHILFRW